MGLGETNLEWAKALLNGLLEAGVRDVVISPGSRSTPLVLASIASPPLRRHVVLDERSAAFVALGLAKGGQRPVALVATSGSAPANWMPAVVEAAAAAVPLLLLSANRPAELQACGANQTIDQQHLFGAHVRAFYPLAEASAAPAMLRYVRRLGARAVDRARWPWPGPVHMDIPLREPLVAEPPAPSPGASVPAGNTPPPCDATPLRIDESRPVLSDAGLRSLADQLAGGKGLILCGPGDFPQGFPAAVSALATHLGSPLLADPLSGLRFGPHDRSPISTRYDAYLRQPSRHAKEGGGPVNPDWVLAFGATPVSKALNQYLLGLDGVPFLVVNPYGPWPDPGHRASRVLHAEPLDLCLRLRSLMAAADERRWLRGFMDLEGHWAQVLERMPRPPFEALLFQVLMATCPDDATLFCSNSMAIRDADSFLSGGSRSLRVVGNRGASGIDGHVSTLLGLAASRPGPVVGVLGDLALWHDMGGFQALAGLDVRDIDLTLVVVNNGGGGIFGYLPQAGLEGFERYWLTPSGLDIAGLARLYGLGYQRIAGTDAGRFAAALTEVLEHARGRTGVDLIEVVVDREESIARHRAYWATATKSETNPMNTAACRI